MRVKGWSKFQHFKDRRPPWIKLYRDLLEKREWFLLSGDAAKTLINVWLISAEQQGELPDVQDLAFRLRMSENELKRQLAKLDSWIEFDDIKLISSRYQDDTPERETETEVETEVEVDTEVCLKTHLSTEGSVDPRVSVPMEEIRSLYHAMCPMLPKTRLPETVKKHVRARYKNGMGNLKAWEDLFRKVADSPFLTGCNKSGWTASFSWIVLPTNLDKIIGGAYDRRQGVVFSEKEQRGISAGQDFLERHGE